ncbi:MAG: hypothetical protein JO113_03765, partial [Candidatus Eremiobacteraeota bacterium]|nr:hypothetical protein [Candidatus Eremiobacteraeota bacterium]
MLLSILYFGQFVLVGAAITTSFNKSRNSLRSLLVAPAVGAAAIALILLPFSRLGFSLGSVAPFVLGVLDVLAVIALLRGRPRLTPAFAWFALPAAVVFLFLGLPLMIYGKDWMAYANQDMLIPLFTADWLTGHGMFSRPVWTDYGLNRNLATCAWVANVFGAGNRTATGVLTSSLAAATGVAPLTAIMPVIVAGYAALTLAAGALVTLRFRTVAAPLVVCLWMALSSQGAYSIFNQHIDQIFGLASLASVIVLLPSRALYAGGGATQVSRSVPAALAITGTLVFYPEFSTVLIASWLVISVKAVRRVRRPFRHWLRTNALLIVVVCIFLNLSILTPLVILSYLNLQPWWGYPDYLIPSGLAVMWGFVGRGEQGMRDLLNVAIAAGGLVFFSLVVAVVVYLRRVYAPAVVAGLMIVAGAYFFERHAGYSVLKIAMYLSPFAIAVFVTAAFDLLRKMRQARGANPQRVALAPLLLVTACAVAGLNGTIYELVRSMNLFDDRSTSLVSIRGSSREHLVSELPAQFRSVGAVTLVSDTPDLPLGQYEGELLKGTPLYFPAGDAVAICAGGGTYAGFLANRREFRIAQRYVRSRRELLPAAAFAFGLGARRQVVEFSEDSRLLNGSVLTSHDALLASSSQLSVINGNTAHASSTVTVIPGDAVSNHLVFVNSSLGIFGVDPRSALGNPEPDFFNKKDTIQLASRRYLLFEVLNPSKRFNVYLSLTETPGGLRPHTVSPVIYGEAPVRLKPSDAGAAQWYSPALSPRWIHGQAYIVLDLGREPTPFPPEPRHGLMSLYGRSTRVDDRLFVAFLRNLSLLSTRELAERSVPTM